MKKVIILMIIMLLFFVLLLEADLIDVYKRGELKLTTDPEYAKNVDWQTVFRYYKDDSKYDTAIDAFVGMAISDDSVFISNRSQSNVFKFDANGNFIKKVAGEGRKTAAKSPLNRRPDKPSILDNKYLVIPEYQGRIGLYDLEGNLVKLMKMEYCVADCVALKNNKIAVLGFVVYKNGRHRDLVAIKDIRTEKENHVTFFVKVLNADTVTVKKNGCWIGFSGPFSRVHAFIRRTKEGNLLVGNSKSPKITIYSPEGKIIKSFNLSTEPAKVTEKAKQEYLDGIKESIKKLKLSENILEKMRTKPGFFPEYTPLYYQLILDSEDNLLVFIYSNDKKNHVFQVYSPEGKYVCDTVIDPGEYDLRINPRLNTMSFFKGNLYGLFELKEGGIRLIRVKF